MINKITRLPRPLGLTMISIQIQKTASPELIENAKQYVMQQWTLEGGMLFGQVISLSQLAEFLKTSLGDLQRIMMKRVVGSNIFNPDQATEVYNQLMSLAVSWALEDRMEIDHQVQVLKISQKGTYTPFISAELNKALGMKITSSNSMQQLVKTMSGGGGGINIFNQVNSNNTAITNNNSITMAEALELITSNIDPSNEAVLEIVDADVEFLASMPEVVAAKQMGVNVDKEGLSIRKADLMKATDDYKGAILESDNTHHEMRREIELRVDTDEEDPEEIIY